MNMSSQWETSPTGSLRQLSRETWPTVSVDLLSKMVTKLPSRQFSIAQPINLQSPIFNSSLLSTSSPFSLSNSCSSCSSCDSPTPSVSTKRLAKQTTVNQSNQECSFTNKFRLELDADDSLHLCGSDLVFGNTDSGLSFSRITLIDCRYPYEFEGGHIRSAVNIPEWPRLRRRLFHVQRKEQNSHQGCQSQSTLDPSVAQTPQRLIVLYCEFSSHRAPQLFYLLRNYDRLMNLANYPALRFPHVYVLHGGYAQFLRRYPALCEPPNGYVRMCTQPKQLAEWRRHCSRLNRANKIDNVNNRREQPASRDRDEGKGRDRERGTVEKVGDKEEGDEEDERGEDRKSSRLGSIVMVVG